MNSAPSLLVTTSFRDRSKSQVWTGESPLAIGHPFKWVIERTERGIRVRSLTGGPEAAQEVSYDKLSSGAEIAIRPLSLKIRALPSAVPAYSRSTQAKGATLKVFLCQGSWIVRSESVQGSYVAAADGKPAFSVSHTDGVTLTSRAENLVIERDGKKARELRSGETLTLEPSELAATAIRVGDSQTLWRLQLVQAPAVDPAAEQPIAPDAETLWFRKALRAAGVGFGAFILLSIVWPKPNPDTQELVPPQFAKIVMKAPTKSAASASSSSESAVAKAASDPKTPAKVQQAAVVQAFRAKALQSAVSGLLKGGMSQLLAQSDFTKGSVNAEAKRIFDTRSEAMRATGANVGAAADKNVKVASLGGEGGGKVGYGKGEKAGLTGQGHAFVSMDIGGSSVEEGLTKDEVGEVIHRHMSEIRYCYESAMLRSPDIEGKLIVDFTIGGVGAVKSSEVKQSTLPDPRLDDCIIRRLVTWKFPNPKGGIDVAVSYPFIFKTLGR